MNEDKYRWNLESYEVCRCGARATRNEFGELVCVDCSQTTNRMLEKRFGGRKQKIVTMATTGVPAKIRKL